MNTKEKIIKYIEKQGKVTANDLVNHLGISRQALFKHHLSKMIEDGSLAKVGMPPKVFYFINEDEQISTSDIKIDKSKKKIIDDNYLTITPSGERKEGWEGFVYWCNKTGQSNIEKVASDYVNIVKKYDKKKKNGLIDGMDKMRKTFDVVSLDEVFYIDFYSVERFGKTKLGQLLLYAKQSQNKKLIKEITQQIKDNVKYVIKKYKIDGVGFIPPTVKREVQLTNEMQRNLDLKVRNISISKIKTSITVPQKTLNKLKDRIENARNTIVVEEKTVFNNILLIDDAVGSGATLNETASQIKSKKICRGKVIGLSVVGSAKGFDVISEV